MKLENHTVNEYRYNSQDGSDDTYEIEIAPIVIPFDETGAMETVLIRAIADMDAESKFIVEEAETFVDKIQRSKEVEKHLQHRGDITKAKYSAVIAIINPQHGSEKYDKLLLELPWEKSPVFEKHFGITKEIL